MDFLYLEFSTIHYKSHMKNIFVLLNLLCILPCYSQSPEVKPCNSEYHHQFDFWEGDWIVFDTANTKIGENKIEFIQNGCAIQENWKSAEGRSTGTSLNYFNREDSTWNQTWIDNYGNPLVLKGQFKDSALVMSDAGQIDTDGRFYKNEISWKLVNDTVVYQIWKKIDQKDSILSTLFFGVYRRK